MRADSTNQTVRMIARGSIAGSRVRVRLANAFGSAPVALGAAHIALREKGSAIVAGSDRALAFNGKPGVTLPPGAVILSDPVDLKIPALADVAVSLYFPGETGTPTIHSTGLHDTYTAEGDATAQASHGGRGGDAIVLLPGRDRRDGAGQRLPGRGLRRFHHGRGTVEQRERP